MDTSTGRFITQDSYAGSVYDPVSLHKYLYANSNPVMYSDPSGYFSLGELSVCSAISSALDTISSNFAMAVWASFIGGFIAVGDQLSTGNLNPKDLLAEFGKGFIAGFAFSLLSMFLPVKLMMAISGLGIICGFAGAVQSFSDGEFWQGVYRASVSTYFSTKWWVNYVDYNRLSTSWYKSDGSINYPPNDGAVPGTEKPITLQPGDKIGRYGGIGEKSTFVTKPGANPEQLSLPPNTDPSIYQEFIVVKPIPETESATIAPWGDSSGGGTQYNLPHTIKWLQDNGYIIPIGK